MLLLGAVNFEVTHSTVSTWAYLACAYVFRAHREPGMAAGPTRVRLSWKWDAWLLHLLNQGQLAPSGTLQCLPPGNVAVFHFVNMQLCRLGWHFVFGEEKRNVAEWVWCVWVTVTKLPVMLLWELWARGWLIRDFCMPFQIKDKWGGKPCVEHLALLFHLAQHPTESGINIIYYLQTEISKR